MLRKVHQPFKTITNAVLRYEIHNVRPHITRLIYCDADAQHPGTLLFPCSQTNSYCITD